MLVLRKCWLRTNVSAAWWGLARFTSTELEPRKVAIWSYFTVNKRWIVCLSVEKNGATGDSIRLHLVDWSTLLFVWYLVWLICFRQKGWLSVPLRLPLTDRPTTFQKMPKVSLGSVSKRTTRWPFLKRGHGKLRGYVVTQTKKGTVWPRNNRVL